MEHPQNVAREAREIRHETREIKSETREDARDASKLHVPIAIMVGAIILTAGVVSSYYSVKESMNQKLVEIKILVTQLDTTMRMHISEKSTAKK